MDNAEKWEEWDRSQNGFSFGSEFSSRKSREAYKQALREAIEERIKEIEPNSELLSSPAKNVIRELQAVLTLLDTVTPK